MAHSPLQPVRVASKRGAVQAALRKLARQLGPGAKLPTVSELCASLEVSRATLDHALAQLEQGQVLVRRHGSGIYVAPGMGQTTIAVLMGHDPFRQSLSPSYQLQIDALHRVLAAHEGRVEVYVDVRSERTDGESIARRHLAADIQSGLIAGGVLLGSSGPEQFDWLSRQNVPFIGLGRGRRGWRVASDAPRLIDVAVLALVRRRCQRIGLVRHLERQRVRKFGDATGRHFQRALTAHGLTFDPRCCRQWMRDVHEWAEPSAPNYEELGYQAGCELAQLPATVRPDGLVILDDMMARGLLVGLTRAGVDVGREMHIATFAMRGSSALLGFEDRIDRVEFDAQDMAAAAWTMLETLLERRRPAVNPVLVPPWRLPACVSDGELNPR